MKTSRRVREIVLTGGPGSGKTSAMEHLVEHLSGRGWRVLVVPEAASLLISGGVRDMGALAAGQRMTYLKVQENLLLLQAELRGRFVSLAEDLADDLFPGEMDPKVVLLHDRAELDNRAYLEPDEFARILRWTVGRSAAEVADQYDAVLCLMSAAHGQGYTTENNTARTESAEEAVALDFATQAAWLGHPHLNVIANEASLEQKLTRVLAAVLNVLGEPEPVEVERKWLLAAAPPAEFLDRAVPVDIEQVYLPDLADGAEQRVRARTYDGHTTYFHTTKRATADGGARIEREQQIDSSTYRLLAGMQAEGTQVVRKRRYCFVESGQHFELDHVQEPVEAWLLEAELVTVGDEARVPDGLAVVAEVTSDVNWRNSALARR